jgi:hypothetical protein
MLGTYPTTETSKGEQITADQAAVAAAVNSILDTATILGQSGTYHEAETSEVAAGVRFGPYSSLVGTYSGVIGSYRMAEAQAVCAGSAAGENFLSGTIIGQDHQSGAISGQCNG